MRFKKLEDRPTDFKTSTGKTIIADKSVALINERTTLRGKVRDRLCSTQPGRSALGQSVHKKLERELHPETISIEAATEEERWALRCALSFVVESCIIQIASNRLINMISCVHSLLQAGRCVTILPMLSVSNVAQSHTA